MSRKGLIIRVLIFGPLFAYFGYGAVQKWRAGQDEERLAAEARAAREAELGAATKKVQLGDGRTIDIVELTPEQAERLHGIKVKEELEKADAKPVTKPEAKVEGTPTPAPATTPSPAPAPAPATSAAAPAN